MPVTAPTDRRLLRGQVKPGRRRSARRSWWRLGVGAALNLALVGGGFALAMRVASSPAVRVSRVVVTGNEWLSVEEVRGRLSGIEGQSIFRVDLEAWRDELLESPWVADVILQRRLPSTIDVRLRERRPVGLGRLGGGLFLVDETGTVIDAYGPRYSTIDLPVIDGLQAKGSRGRQVDGARIDLAARLLGALGRRPDLARLVSQVDVSDAQNAVIILDKDTALVRLGHERFAERLQSYLELAPAIRETVPDIDYVDLRFGERVYVGAASAPVVPLTMAAAREPGAPPGR